MNNPTPKGGDKGKSARDRDDKALDRAAKQSDSNPTGALKALDRLIRRKP